MDPSASGVLVGAASALACGVACVSARPPSERQIEAEIMRNVRVVEPSSGEHKLTALLLPGFTGSVEELIPWFQRLGEPVAPAPLPPSCSSWLTMALRRG